MQFTKPLTAEEELYLCTICDDIDLQNSGDHDDWIKPKGYNGYIQLVIAKDKSGIKWDGGEKFYDAVDAVNTVIMTMQTKFPDFGLTGTLRAQGEEIGDVWDLTIVNGKAIEKIPPKSDDFITCPHCEEKFKIAESI